MTKSESMGREDYKAFVEKQNGYCSCPELQLLFELRKEAIALEASCNLYENSTDLKKPAERDRPLLLEYERSAKRLRTTSDNYHQLLTNLVNVGKLHLFLHGGKRDDDIMPISHGDLSALLKSGQKLITTVNCARCSQQIDLISRSE